MESNDAQRQLSEIDRLKAATQVESTAVAAWAWPVLVVVAMVATFTSFQFLDEPWQAIVSAAWCVFVAIWIRVIRRNNRAVRPRVERTAGQRKKDIKEWVVLLVAANAITFGLSRISWTVAGIGMAIFCSFAGGVFSRRGRRA